MAAAGAEDESAVLAGASAGLLVEPPAAEPKENGAGEEAFVAASLAGFLKVKPLLGAIVPFVAVAVVDDDVDAAELPNENPFVFLAAGSSSSLSASLFLDESTEGAASKPLNPPKAPPAAWD